jgi:hypothetical protein
MGQGLRCAHAMHRRAMHDAVESGLPAPTTDVSSIALSFRIGKRKRKFGMPHIFWLPRREHKIVPARRPAKLGCTRRNLDCGSSRLPREHGERGEPAYSQNQNKSAMVWKRLSLATGEYLGR